MTFPNIINLKNNNNNKKTSPTYMKDYFLI